MRRFTHHAFQTRDAQPLNDWLEKAGPVGSLMERARALAALEAEVLSLLPPGMREAIVVAGVKQDPQSNTRESTLLLLAAHGAAASRVRQIVPTLLDRLQERGSRIATIRVRVQPDVGRQNDWDVGERKPEPRRGIAPSGLASLAGLADNIEDSPLRDALKALLAHHKPGG